MNYVHGDLHEYFEDPNKCATTSYKAAFTLKVMTITMYGANWCGDCRRAEKFFIDNNIDFQKIDLELDENEHFVESEVLRRNNGKKSIPVIVFDDDSHLTEPTNAQLAEKLGL